MKPQLREPRAVLDEMIDSYIMDLGEFKKDLDATDARNRQHIKLYCEMNNIPVAEYLSRYGVKWREMIKLMGWVI